LLGVQSGIPQDVKDALGLAGTSHIIIITGFTNTSITGLFSLLLVVFWVSPMILRLEHRPERLDRDYSGTKKVVSGGGEKVGAMLKWG
jgi:predicted membrane metal-binding protein